MREGQATLSIGTVILGRYTIEDVLSKDASGATYLVADQRLKHTVPNNLFVLKEIIDPFKQERYQLVFEGTLLKQLHHKALPHFYHVYNSEEQGRVSMLMEYIEGTNLEKLRQRQPGQRFTWSEVKEMMAPIIDAVSYLHHQQHPILHRDIKPANIIESTSEGSRIFLVDFGYIKQFDPTSATTGYRAPE